MSYPRLFLLFSLLYSSVFAIAQGSTVRVSSPNGQLVLSLSTGPAQPVPNAPPRARHQETAAPPEGTKRHLLCNMFPMFGPDGAIMGAISTHVDITARKEYEQQVGSYSAALVVQKGELEAANAKLEALATTDGLTGLKNHRAFQERLAQELHRGAQSYTPLSVLMLFGVWAGGLILSFGMLQWADGASWATRRRCNRSERSFT